MLLLMLTLVLASGSEQAEQTIDQPSRAEELQVARENKSQNLVAPRRSFLEKKLYQIKEQRIMERFQNGFAGFHPRIGGMRTGSGFALGSVYTKGSLNTSAQVSFKGYQKYEVRYSADQFLGSRYFADARATYRNYTQES